MNKFLYDYENDNYSSLLLSIHTEDNDGIIAKSLEDECSINRCDRPHIYLGRLYFKIVCNNVYEKTKKKLCSSRPFNKYFRYKKII